MLSSSRPRRPPPAGISYVLPASLEAAWRGGDSVPDAPPATLRVGASAGGAAALGAGGSSATADGGPIVSAGGVPVSAGGTLVSSGGLAVSAGGAIVSAGGSPATVADGSAGCPLGWKLCGGSCTPPTPRFGCGRSGCAPCNIVPPANGYVTCAADVCAWDCPPGFSKNGIACEGAALPIQGSCNPSACPGCGAYGMGCCVARGKCSCPAVPWVPETCEG